MDLGLFLLVPAEQQRILLPQLFDLFVLHLQHFVEGIVGLNPLLGFRIYEICLLVESLELEPQLLNRGGIHGSFHFLISFVPLPLFKQKLVFAFKVFHLGIQVDILLLELSELVQLVLEPEYQGVFGLVARLEVLRFSLVEHV